MTVEMQRIAQLTPEKRLLLEMLLKKKRAAAAGGGGDGAAVTGKAEAAEARGAAATRTVAARPAVAPFAMLNDDDRAKLPADLEDAYPLGMAQLGMLYHMDLAPDDPTPAYHNVNSWHGRGHFDAAVFQEAVNRVVRSHPILRTSFDLTGFSEPLQLVHREAHLPVVVLDLRRLGDEAQRREIHRFIELENRRLLDLSQPPLMRFHVHLRSDETFQFTLTEPHAISDGWSTTSTLAEVFELYFRLLRGEEVPEPEPLVGSYRDFVLREREMLGSQESRAYWDRVLADCNVVRLPRWPSSYRGARGREDRKPYHLLDRELVAGLRRMADRAGVPLKSVLLASYFKAMSLVSGLRDLNLGLVTNARPEQRDGERLRGLFLNPLPLRVRIPDGSWIDLVRAVFEAEVEMLPYRVYPLQALQRKWGREPLFEVAFTYLNFHSVENLLSSGDVELLDLDEATDLSVTHFTLSVLFRTYPLDPMRIALLLEYDDAELTAGQIEAWWGYFRQILESMAAEPEASHDGRSYLTAEQSDRLARWNDTAAAPPPWATVAEWIAARAAAAPEAPAVR
ncbi:MAG TPA: condensation domain-containing protein, partial [Thermoanaerobaculia bacterium]|nr:condensation domain-containing protein [Thermoanaerobaculia bacterium]